MNKIYKKINFVLIFILIEILSCQNVIYALDISHLRAPLDTITTRQRLEKGLDALNKFRHGDGEAIRSSEEALSLLTTHLDILCNSNLIEDAEVRTKILNNIEIICNSGYIAESVTESIKSFLSIAAYLPMLNSMIGRYQEMSSKTPDFFVIQIQKSVYKAKEILKNQKTDNEIARSLNNPVELGPALAYYTTNRIGNPGLSTEILVDKLLQNLPKEKRELLDRFSKKDIVDYLMMVGEIYQEERSRLVPDIVFRPESGLVFPYGNKTYVFVSNFTSKHGHGTRVAEVKYNRAWFVSQGYEIIDIPERYPFEGSADVKYVKHGDRLDIVFGWGFRTDNQTIGWVSDKIKDIVGSDFDTKIKILPAHIIDESYYHIDTALKEIPVIEDGEIVDETIMYYPFAFDKDTQEVLKRAFPDALILAKEDAKSFACNSPTVGKSIIIDDRVTEMLREELRSRGIKVVPIDLSEFAKAGGGGKCLVLELDKDIYSLDPAYNNKIQMMDSPKGLFDVAYVNDPWMKGHIGRVNKGLADKQHSILAEALKNEGMEIKFFDSSEFRQEYDFEILRKASYEVVVEQGIDKDRLDEIVWQAAKNFKEYEDTGKLPEDSDSALLKKIYITYADLYNSFPEYSWSVLLHALYQEMLSRDKSDNLVINDDIISRPGDIFPYIDKVTNFYNTITVQLIGEESTLSGMTKQHDLPQRDIAPLPSLYDVTLYDVIHQTLKATARELYGAEIPQLVRVEIPTKREYGDYSSNIAFLLAKDLKENPKKIAQRVADSINQKALGYKSEALEGFINFRLTDTVLFKNLLLLENIAGAPRLVMPEYKDKKINLEYVSANPTGPLHIGHGRWAALGSSIAKILRFAGAEVTEEFYINDAGAQIKNLEKSVEAVRKGDPVPEDGYHGDYIEELAKLPGAADVILLEQQKEILRKFNTNFDVFFSEKTLHANESIAGSLEKLQQAGYIYEKDGAAWFKSTAFGDDKDRVLMRSNGEPTYLAADVAYHNDKVSRDFDLLINIWGADHHGYVPRLTGAVKALKPDQEIEIILGQLVKLSRGGEPIKMSKRSGNMITLEEVIDEIGVDATRYFLLRQKADSEINFDLNIAKEKTEQNPLFYVQYAHARISSILAKMKQEGIVVKDQESIGEFNGSERELAIKLLEFTSRIKTAALAKDPSKLTNYAEELASSFHRFYHASPVITDDSKDVYRRYHLIIATRLILRDIMALLGVSAPEHMDKRTDRHESLSDQIDKISKEVLTGA